MFLSLCTCLCVHNTSCPLSDNATKGISMFVDFLVCKFPPCSECLLSLFWKPHVGCCQLFYSLSDLCLPHSLNPVCLSYTTGPARHQIRPRSCKKAQQNPSEALCANNTPHTFTCENTGPYLKFSERLGQEDSTCVGMQICNR